MKGWLARTGAAEGAGRRWRAWPIVRPAGGTRAGIDGRQTGLRISTSAAFSAPRSSLIAGDAPGVFSSGFSGSSTGRSPGRAARRRASDRPPARRKPGSWPDGRRTIWALISICFSASAGRASGPAISQSRNASPVGVGSGATQRCRRHGAIAALRARHGEDDIEAHRQARGADLALAPGSARENRR